MWHRSRRHQDWLEFFFWKAHPGDHSKSARPCCCMYSRQTCIYKPYWLLKKYEFKVFWMLSKVRECVIVAVLSAKQTLMPAAVRTLNETVILVHHIEHKSGNMFWICSINLWRNKKQFSVFEKRLVKLFFIILSAYFHPILSSSVQQLLLCRLHVIFIRNYYYFHNCTSPGTWVSESSESMS